jgi:hypothetical protein
MPSLVSYATLLMLALVVTSGWAQAASFTFTLQPGWNLISFPVLPEDHSPAAVFGAMKDSTGKILYAPFIEGKAANRDNQP